MTKEQLLRLRGYWLLLEASWGDISVLSPDDQKDLKQLVEKWLKENYD